MRNAIILFASKGYDAVGVQEICEKSGVTKPTLYHYFESKNGLLRTVLATRSQPFIEELRKECIYKRDLTNSLHRIASCFFKFSSKNKDFYRLLLALFFTPPDNEANIACREIREKIFELIKDLFEKSIEEHGNMRGKHIMYAASFVGQIDTYIGLSLNTYLDLRDPLVYALVKSFMHGILS